MILLLDKPSSKSAACIMALTVSLFFLVSPLGAQSSDSDTEVPSPAGRASTTHLRAWAGFPLDYANIERYSIEFEAPTANFKGHVLAGVAGFGSTSFGPSDFLEAPAARYRFRLVKDGAATDAPPLASTEANLHGDRAYTLLATIDPATGRAALQIVQEFPSDPELDGLYILNLIHDVPLALTVPGSKPQRIARTESPSFVPSSALGNASLIFHTKNRRGRNIEIPYKYEGGRRTVVFMRDMYGQATVAPFDAIPLPDAESTDPDTQDGSVAQTEENFRLTTGGQQP